VPAENILVVENGEVVELANGKLSKGERIPGGYVFVDGQSIGDIDHGVMREREKLARSGIFLIDLNVDKYSGRLLGEPEILTRGFLSPMMLRSCSPRSASVLWISSTAAGWMLKKISPAQSSLSCTTKPSVDQWFL